MASQKVLIRAQMPAVVATTKSVPRLQNFKVRAPASRSLTWRAGVAVAAAAAAVAAGTEAAAVAVAAVAVVTGTAVVVVVVVAAAAGRADVAAARAL